jgi:hypothetical protein
MKIDMQRSRPWAAFFVAAELVSVGVRGWKRKGEARSVQEDSVATGSATKAKALETVATVF